MDTNWRSTAGIVSSYNRLFLHSKDYTKDDFETIEDNNAFSDGISYQLIKSTKMLK